MRVKAINTLSGDYGIKVPGEEFECDDSTANQLLSMGRVTYALPPRVQYEVKVIVPAEALVVSAREPFRDSLVSLTQSQAVVAEGDTVLSGPELSQHGATDSRGRGRRSGPAA